MIAAGLAALSLLSACSSAPIKVECREIQTRMDYSDLSDDQRRFAQQELEDCRNRLKDAEARDSAQAEGVEQKFTPDAP